MKMSRFGGLLKVSPLGPLDRHWTSILEAHDSVQGREGCGKGGGDTCIHLWVSPEISRTGVTGKAIDFLSDGVRALSF